MTAMPAAVKEAMLEEAEEPVVVVVLLVVVVVVGQKNSQKTRKAMRQAKVKAVVRLMALAQASSCGSL